MTTRTVKSPADAERAPAPVSIPTCRSTSCASSSRRPSPARTRWARAIGTSPTRSPSRRCGSEMDSVPIDGTIVIGEGERDEAPMLYIGEKVGMAVKDTGGRHYPEVDIAVDPLEGTNLCATGAPNALAVLAASEQRRAAARARPLHGEAGRRAELARRRRPRRAGALQPARDRAGARPPRRGPGRHRARSARGTRS